MGAMTIQGTELQIKEYRDQRVVTFKDIDTLHQRPMGTANKRFLDNRNRFISGVDFYKISPSEFRNTIDHMDARQQNNVTLITESGYLMLVKSFTDDLAWKVQRELVDTYFRIRAEPEVIEQTVTLTESTPKENPEIYLEASRIMSGCMEGNRPYVLNILRHIVPDVDLLQMQEKVTEVKTEVKTLTDGRKNNRPPFYKVGVEIDVERLKLALNCKHMTSRDLAYKVDVCVQTANNWVTGRRRPTPENMVKICAALGEDENFLKPRRTRRTK